MAHFPICFWIWIVFHVTLCLSDPRLAPSVSSILKFPSRNPFKDHCINTKKWKKKYQLSIYTFLWDANNQVKPSWNFFFLLNFQRWFQNCTSLDRGYSSDSSMRTTWLVFGLFSESGSTHLNAVRRARLRALVDGLVSIVGSTTSSERLLATIIFNHSTRFTWKMHPIGSSQDIHWTVLSLLV